MLKRTGGKTLIFSNKPTISGFASVVGKKEAEGPLKDEFDKIIYDPHAGQNTWEKAESAFQKEAVNIALEKSGMSASDMGFIFAGDLLNQCISSSYGLRDYNIPYLGQYGACSTMAQGLIMAAVMIESGACAAASCVTSSHFCAAERQYRFPLEYGGQRTPTSQWTVTGAGSCVVSNLGKKGKPYIHAATVGRIVDLGVTDQNNMGAAMAPAAVQTLCDFFNDTLTTVDDYDVIFTGDLGKVGSDLMYKLLQKNDVNIENKHFDCGKMIYADDDMDVHAGASGCGCCASVLCSHILNAVERGVYENVLFIATGALMSPTSIQQGESIPSIAHLVNIKLRKS